jgi:hypothetical protein
MPMHIAVRKLGGSLFCFSLFESICLFYKTSFLACNHLQIWWWGCGGDSILWLSFAQQKYRKTIFRLAERFCR